MRNEEKVTGKDEFELWMETSMGKRTLEMISEFPQNNHISALCRAYCAGKCAGFIDSFKIHQGYDMPPDLLKAFTLEDE